jgi:hypothetical protein
MKTVELPPCLQTSHEEELQNSVITKFPNHILSLTIYSYLLELSLAYAELRSVWALDLGLAAVPIHSMYLISSDINPSILELAQLVALFIKSYSDTIRSQ